MYTNSVKGLFLAFCLLRASVCCSSIILSALKSNLSGTNSNYLSFSSHSSNQNQTSPDVNNEPSSRMNETADVCKTSICLRSADQILRTMNSSIKPCDDFYQYACGSWAKSSIVPEDRLDFSPFTPIRNDMLRRFYGILERDPHESDKNTTVGKMRILYKSCLRSRIAIPPLDGLLKFIVGTRHRLNRRERCLEVAIAFFGHPLSSLYLKQIAHFNTDTETVHGLVPYVKDAFIAEIKQTAWMDEETKKGAEAKVNGMSSRIGFHEEFLNETLWQETYTNLSIGINFSANCRNLNEFFEHYNVEIWKKKLISIARAIKIDPFYGAEDNSINIAAESIRAIQYDKARPNYLNFGSIGSVIGHEIGHAFDFTSRHRDKDGKVNNWWSDEASRQFEDRSKCLVDQFSKVLEPDTKMYVNGSLTLNENISDNLGFKIAFRSYDNWANKNGEEPLLPGLTDLTPRQLFWVSTANVFCTRYNPKLLKTYLIEDPHTPKTLRVNAALSNMKEFSETFNCPVGSPMNPVNKCSAW